MLIVVTKFYTWYKSDKIYDEKKIYFKYVLQLCTVYVCKEDSRICIELWHSYKYWQSIINLCLSSTIVAAIMWIYRQLFTYLYVSTYTYIYRHTHT